MENINGIMRLKGYKYGVDERALKHWNEIAFKFNLCEMADQEYLIRRFNAIIDTYTKFSVREEDFIKIVMDGIKLKVDFVNNIVQFVAVRNEEGECFHEGEMPGYKKKVLRASYKRNRIDLRDSDILSGRRYIVA